MSYADATRSLDNIRRENMMERRIRSAERTIERAQAQIDHLLSLPDEPEVTDKDGALAIWFERRFQRGGTKYTYAAVKAGDGLWYTTGPQSPKGYTWIQLIDWLTRYEDDHGAVKVWVATEWSALS